MTMPPRPRRSLLVISLLLAACSSSSTNFRIVVSNSAIAERHRGGPTMVACYRDGQLHGADAVSDADFPGGWFDATDLVDHPKLPLWRAQLTRMQTLASARDGDADDLARAVADFPFRAPVEAACATWVDDRPERAADLLDRADALSVGDTFAEQLARTALEGQVDDARIAAWVGTVMAADHDEAAVLLVQSQAAGPRTADAALLRLDDCASRHRLTIFTAAAERLRTEPDAAYRLVAAVEDLRSVDECEALAALLRADPAPELAREVLRRLDDRPSSGRRDLFVLAARTASRDPRSHFAVVRALEAVPSSRRLDAALAVLALDDIDPGLVQMFAESAGELRSADRLELLTAVFDGPCGGDPAVRNACADAARRHLARRDRDRVLQRLDADRER